MSRTLVPVAIAAFATLSFAAGAGADTLAQAKPAGTSFESLDKNSDGKVSLDEASANDKLFTVFKGLDANKDGVLTKEEYIAYDPASASNKGKG